MVSRRASLVACLLVGACSDFSTSSGSAEAGADGASPDASATDSAAEDALDATPFDASDARDDVLDATDPFGPLQCPATKVQVGEFATWGGKVNVHRSAGGAWAVDADCTSGATNNTLLYCQKFWPTSEQIVHLTAPTAMLKPFTEGGGVAPACGNIHDNPGVDQWACCALP